MSGPLSDLFASDAEFREDMVLPGYLRELGMTAQSFHDAESSDEAFAALNSGGPDAPSGG